MAKKGGSKQKKMNARVDFTPMVDMIMLLVTFFMLCTTLLKPQTMEIAMPADKDKANQENPSSEVSKKDVVTIYVADDGKIFYCAGDPTKDPIKETQYGKDGIRKVLLNKNDVAAKQVEALKLEFAAKFSSNVAEAEKNKEAYNEKLKEIKSNSEIVVIIKPSENSTYLNLIDVLDEMQNCYIGKYFVDKVNQSDADIVKTAGGTMTVPEEKASAATAQN